MPSRYMSPDAAAGSPAWGWPPYEILPPNAPEPTPFKVWQPFLDVMGKNQRGSAVSRIGSHGIFATVEAGSGYKHHPFNGLKRKAGSGAQRLRLSGTEGVPSRKKRHAARLSDRQPPGAPRRWISRRHHTGPAACVAHLFSVGGALDYRSTSPHRAAALRPWASA